MPELVLPVAVLQADGDGPLRVELRCARTERRRLRDWFDRLTCLGLPWLALPERVFDSSSGLTLEYAPALRGSASASTCATEWGHDLATALPDVLGLARFTLMAAAELARHKADEAPICPALLRSELADPTQWRIVALPAGTATLADWAKADPDAWGWASPATLLVGRTADPVHTLGSALHHGLVGRMFPEPLQDREKFARVLRGRIGLSARLTAAIHAATPVQCRSDAEALRQLTLDCLDPVPGRRPTEAEARSRFAELEGKLSVDRLVRAWEAESRSVTAGKLRRRGGFPLPPPPPPLPTPPPLPPGKDWSDKAREDLDRGDVSSALSATWNAVFTEGPQKIDLYLMSVQRTAALSPRSEIVAALARLDEAYSAELIGEANLLRIAHVRMRYLGATEAEVYPLLQTSQSDWTSAVGRLLRAVLQVRKSGGYAETSKLCKEASDGFARMPQGGREVGRYARAYLALLDGIAHIGFVAAGGPTDYYSDALTRFGTALQLADEVGTRDLLRATSQWLAWLSWLAGLTPGPAATTIRTAAEVMLRLHGGTGPGLGVRETPEIPWYDEAYVFPV